LNAIVVPQPNYAVSDLERMARAFATSKLFGVQNPEQALALCLVAQAEGRHPATAAQDYSIIQGRPSKKADAMLRDFLSAGGKVEWHTLSDEKADATFSHPAGGSARIDWTIDRANKAGLAGNAMYKKYPRQMLRSRTVSEGVRTVCPGATSGMYVPEEVQDIVHEVEERAPPQQALTGPAPDADMGGDFAPVIERKSSAQAKKDGDHDRINKMIDQADADRLDTLEATFDEWTAELPSRWLDPVRDRIASRRAELAGAETVAEAEAELDDRFRDVVGLVRGSDLARRDADHASAAA
jgi:hypothetical protein